MATRSLLNLGAGNKLDTRPGSVNHDRTKHRPEIDIVHNLDDFPWPWEDDSFDTIMAWAVLEHLQANLITSFDECWRILKPGGLLKVKLPFWNVDQSYADPTHYWVFSLRALDQFVPTTERGQQYSFYTPFKWSWNKEPEKCSASAFSATLAKVPR